MLRLVLNNEPDFRGKLLWFIFAEQVSTTKMVRIGKEKRSQ